MVSQARSRAEGRHARKIRTPLALEAPLGAFRAREREDAGVYAFV